MGFLVICSGVILLQLSKSAKDVPDAAVFKGDLDQMRTVAEQQEHMSEPKADAIRGAAGLLRSFSKSHLRREAEEAKRIQEERMEPIGENEQVEWDGPRRRKTILGPGESPILRRKTLHPPLGMAHFPDESDADHGDEETLPGLFLIYVNALTPCFTRTPIANAVQPAVAAAAANEDPAPTQ